MKKRIRKRWYLLGAAVMCIAALILYIKWDDITYRPLTPSQVTSVTVDPHDYYTYKAVTFSDSVSVQKVIELEDLLHRTAKVNPMANCIIDTFTFTYTLSDGSVSERIYKMQHPSEEIEKKLVDSSIALTTAWTTTTTTPPTVTTRTSGNTTHT